MTMKTIIRVQYEPWYLVDSHRQRLSDDGTVYSSYTLHPTPYTLHPTPYIHLTPSSKPCLIHTAPKNTRAQVVHGSLEDFFTRERDAFIFPGLVCK